MQSGTTRTRRENFFLILMLGALSTLTPFSIDMYLPAFPQIANDLRTTIARVSVSVSTYFIGYALGQILYGPLLDRFGRKPPLYAGLGLYILASVGCMCAHTIEALFLCRFFQAIGGSAASVAAVTMVRDFFPAQEGAKVFSLLMLVLSVSPMLAPTFGSYVVLAWGWSAVFGILTAIAILILLMVIFFLPEGQAADPSVSLRLRPIFRTFGQILRDPQFLTYTLAGSFAFAGLFVYIAGSPSIFMDGFGVSAKAYGGIFAFIAAGLIGGSQLNIALAKKLDGTRIFKLALRSQFVLSQIFLIGVLNGWYGLFSTIGFIFGILLAAGLCYPNAAAAALAPFSKNAGSAAALLGFFQMGLGAMLSSTVGLGNFKGSLPTAVVIACASTLGLIVLGWGKSWGQSRRLMKNES